MKILFISDGGNTQDYQRDCCFHGLRSLLGPDVVDVNRLDSMYVGADRSQMYGKGFTLYGELPDIEVDRTDIPSKINHKYFDLVIYASIHRNRDYLHEVVAKYQTPSVVFIDGEDHPGYLKGLGGITFKRELYNAQPNCFPIHFAIPKNKILKFRTEKSLIVAPCDPISRKTYVYNDEASYYKQYADSCFAATMKKAGWDCLRHYEILSQWTIPYFRVFDACPPLICHDLPRPELLFVKAKFEQLYPQSSKSLTRIYDFLIEDIMTIVREKLTTEALALYMFDTIGISTHTEVSLGA